MIKIACVVGARPNFMKIAPILKAMEAYPDMIPLLVHTGQHYDFEMSQVFFNQLDIPEPQINLGIGSESHAVQTAKIMIGFEKVVSHHKSDYILVVGDVNSTIACALVGVKMGVPVIHVEAGIRSFDKTMPEEINRILTDHVSELLLAPTVFACDNLKNESIIKNVYLVGDVMIDTLLKHKEKASNSGIKDSLSVNGEDYCLMTLHRASNVDDEVNLSCIIDAVDYIQRQIVVVLPLHPRTRAKLYLFGLYDKLSSMGKIVITEPLGYLECLNLMMDSKFVLTDSGGMQTETTVLNIPCLTMRTNTERPETLIQGTNTLVGIGSIIGNSQKILDGKGKQGTYPKIWDGHSAERIVSIISKL